MPKPKKRYFPNNWKQIKDAPSHYFEPCDYEDFMEWKMGGWVIPTDVNCIIRETNFITGKVKEYTYQRPEAARKRAERIVNEQQSEFIVCTSDNIHHLYPTLSEEDYDDPLA